MNHYENVKALAADNDKAELKIEKVKQGKSVESVCHEMNHYENVKTLATDDEKTELKKMKMKMGKSIESECLAHCSFDEMGTASVSITGDGTADTKDEEIEQNEMNYYYTRRRCCRKCLKYAFITVAVIAVVVFIILIAMPFKKNNITPHTKPTNGNITNPCALDLGGCEQLCIPTGSNARKCACRMGWKLNDDEHSCREVREFLVYVQGDSVRIGSLDGETKHLIWPTPYKVDSVVSKGEIDFDYDSRNDYFYWADDRHIYRVKLRNFDGIWMTILSINEPNVTLLNIAYDWYTGNMYFVKRRSDSHQLMLFNVNHGEKQQETLMTYYYNEGSNLRACPYVLRLQPAEHSIPCACQLFVMRATVNNTYINEMLSSFPQFKEEHWLVAVDNAKDRVYWISSSELVTIVKHANVVGSDVRVISVSSVRNGRMIDVYEGWLYVGNSTGIWRVDKETGKGAVQIVDGGNSGFKVGSEKVHSSDDKNECAEEYMEKEFRIESPVEEVPDGSGK